ncbi:hypothetical protein ACFX13_005068 [Malus domestica]|uniref:pentatricopeptide repeat-containing protein At2g33760 n=1 Tax=Malus domestica TaxID=3750 RepID=UPI000498F1E8|nr:pentatricopeptide repeat-containing protein At2g33760 [Malus domestica]
MEAKQLRHDLGVAGSAPKSPAYLALLRAGPRIKPLQQVHAHLVVSGSHRSRALLTKLLTLACEAGSIFYTHRLFLSVPIPDAFLFNSLIKASSKFGFPQYTVFFYHSMLAFCIPPSSYTFTSVIKSCADLSDLRLGRGVHSHALVCGYGADSFVQAALVSLYSKSGDLGAAWKMFDKMPDRNVVAWNSMISGYEQNGLSKEAIVVFDQMRELGVEPDSTTFVSVLAACSQLGALGLGCSVHRDVINSGLHVNVALGSSLINMYARCGNVSKAREVFDSMKERNVIAWTAMISGYATNGYGTQAVELFREMKARGPVPNTITFVAVLAACAHAGLVPEGREAFASMRQDYGLVPSVEHHVCLVDMLGRAGLLNEAYQLIKELGAEEAAPAVWTAMLGACKMHKNFDLGVIVAEHLLEVEPENPGHYVMLSNIYALAGRMDRVEMIRNMMMGRSLRKRVGYSTIDLNHRTYLFSMGDKSHPETSEVYQHLDELMSRCREAGYAPAPESVMHEVEEEEREYALRYHSEKLAITFGLLKTKDGVSIRIVKNLRMCEDCHEAIKFISIVTKREIIVRDKLRFHHFKDGSCSCMDYW